MKIKTKWGKTEDVFAMYVLGGEGYFYTLPEGLGLLVAYKIKDVTVTDPSISWKGTFFKSGIFHHSLIEEELLDDLLEADPGKYRNFISILKTEGSLPQDFSEVID